MEKSRTEYSTMNTVVAMISRIAAILMGFVTRVVFTHTLSESYVGINGLFTDILNVLSLTELGVETAISYALYRPIAQGDIRKQQILMRMFRTFYRITAGCVVVLGLSIIPFFDVLMKNRPDVDHLMLIYFLYLANSVVSYLLVYKRTLIEVHQLNYIVLLYQTAFLILQDICQIVILFTTHNFIFFLSIYIVCTLLSNICISRKADRMYPYLKEKMKEQLPEDERKDIFRNIKAMLMHKLGNVVVNNTDNLLISSFVGVISVGIYSNYFLLIGSVRQVLDQIFQGITASVGNLGATEDLGMEPLYVCNCGMTCQGRKPVLLTGKEQDEILEDTMNALEYALGSPESRWGSLRTQMGHREPFGLTYLEIGNENFGPDYEERYRRFYDVVKEKYPHLKVIANAHIEEHACTTEYVDEHFYNSTEFFAENQNYYENYDRKGPKIFVGEQAVNEGAHLGKLYGALGEAAFLIGLEKNQDVVALASYAPLFEHVHYHSWSPNLIRFQNAESFGIPTYYVWKMFGKNRGSYVVESEVESGKIYRPMEGMASLKSRSVLNYKNAMWNGRKTAVTHEMMGHVMEEEEDGSCCIGHPDEEQIAAMCRKMPWGDKEKSFVVFGEESDTCGKFDVDIYVEPGSSFEIGIFSARVILSYYDQLLEGAEKIWTPFGVRPLLWKIEEDHASFWETAIPEEKRLTEDFPLCIEPGRYHHFGYETDGKTVRLFIDRKIVREVEIPSFPAVSSVTTVTEDEIFIKLVNMEGKTDPIEISLDCGVEREYEAVLLTGEKTAENTFEEPEKVSDKTVKMEGASKKFIYEAPAYSVSVLRLKKKQAFNPYLPSWEYIPDGEPYVFGDRVYVYGSHDFYNGHVFCLGDYVCWSAPVDNLADWRYEGVIYPKTEDPLNRDGKMCLYAPDVTVGPDGRYYLYYVLDHVSVVSVAVSDTPAGKYEFYGYVHDKKGDRLGERPGDEPQFDPGVLTEGARTYLYTGFCGRGDKTRHGAMATVLGPDMITIEEEPVFVAPGGEYADGTGYEGHAFFEAPSIRKIGNTYYLIYSSSVMHELCYATSEKPTGKFTYRGVLVSNCDMHIDTYKPADMPSAYGGNNHGSIVEISSEWYIFYHRQTNGTWYSRQGCAEKLHLAEDGSFRQVELTSCGLNGGSLVGRGEYPAYIACNLFTAEESIFDANQRFPRVMQDGRDGDKEPGYISHITDTTTLGFKYFECENVQKVILKVRGYGSGTFEVKTAWDGEVLGTVQIVNSNVWEKYEIQAQIPDGKQAIYFTYRGYGNLDLLSFTLE